MGELISNILDINEKEENKNEEINRMSYKEEKIKIIESKSILIDKDRFNYPQKNLLYYIDEIKLLICFYDYKIYCFSYPSFIRNIDYEEFINTMEISYYNYQKNSNKLYVNYFGNEYANIFLIQKKSIKLLFEKIPLQIKDLIEISLQRIIVLDYNNSCICFEFKNNEYKKIKTFGENGGKIYTPKGLIVNDVFIYSIKISPNRKKFFIINRIGIQVFDSKTLELINILFIDNMDACFLDNNHFVTICNTTVNLFDLTTFKKLDTLNVFFKDGGRLQKLENTPYFIAAQWKTVASVVILELKNNKINYVRKINDFSIPYNSSINFNNTIFIDSGFEKIFIYKLDFNNKI